MNRNRKETRNQRDGQLVLVLILGLMLIMPLAALADDRFEQKLEKVESLAKDGQVMINNISGDIRISVWKEDKVKIEAIKRAEARDESEAKKAMEEVEIQIKAEPGLVTIKTRYPENRGFFGRDTSVSVDYTLWIPEKASVEARSVSGDIEIAEAGGQIVANTVSGDVEISGGKSQSWPKPSAETLRSRRSRVMPS